MQIERDRIANIREFGKQASMEEAFINDLVNRGIPATQAREAIVKKWADRVDGQTSRGDTSDIEYSARGSYGQHHVHGAMIDGLLIRSGIKLDKPHPAARDFAGISIHEMSHYCVSVAIMTVLIHRQD